MAKRILLLGASKHIGLHVLEDLAPHPLQYQCFVIARTPADRIATFPGKENVRFIAGDAKDEKTVSKVIFETMQGRVDYVVMTVGGTIVFNSYFMPRFSDPTLCGDVAETLVTALRPISDPPVIIAVSSTGILSTRDILPAPLKPLYRAVLHKPHEDKIAMEETIAGADEKVGYESGRWILPRPALYTDGKRTGVYRAGETEKGYTISRRDVADFIVKECIDGDGKWVGKRPVVVY
jgi:hypothetical protein